MSQDFLEEFSRETQFYPLLSRKSSSSKDLSRKEYSFLWAGFETLPEEIRDILASPEIPEKLKFLQTKTRFSNETIEWISAIIREYFILTRDAHWLQKTLSLNMAPEAVSLVCSFLQQHIFSTKHTVVQPKKENRANIARLPLLDAMGRYPRIGEQVLTIDRITVQGESNPVRGNVRNWLRSYRDTLGIRKHSNMERGQFLFQNNNTRHLPKDERMRLSVLLKSLDDKTPLDIDIIRKEILFPDIEDSLKNMGSKEDLPQRQSMPQTAAPKESFQTPQNPPLTNERLRITPEKSRQINTSPSSEKVPTNSVSMKEPVSFTATDNAKENPLEKDGFSFSAGHIFPHEKAHALGIEKYQENKES